MRVVVAEDEGLIRDALTTLLDLEPDMTVVSVHERGDDAENWLLAHEADVAVLDNHLPGRTGIEVAGRLRRAGVRAAVVILSGSARPQDLRLALAVPVLGFCSKGVSGSQLAQTIRSVYAGQRYIDPDLAAAALAAQQNPLRDKEIAVLRLVAEGLPTDRIAAQLHLSPGTVRNYVSSACSKIGGANKIAAVRTARQEGWI
ncbi:response regulator [Kineococcus sp. R8]|nr:response regulator [Kineococcus siccus]